MIEIAVVNFVAQRLSVPVYMEYPNNAPDRFVILDRSDTNRENHIETSLFIAQSYAESKLEAANLNQQVKAVMDALVDLEQVSCSELNSDYPFPDTQRKRHRYQAVYNITHY